MGRRARVGGHMGCAGGRMSLRVILNHPSVGSRAPLVTGGSLTCALDRYPRWGLDVSLVHGPGETDLLRTPYGSRALVDTPDGVRLFSGYVMDTSAARPSGTVSLQAMDPMVLFQQAKFTGNPNFRLGGGMMTLPQWIERIAVARGLPVPRIVVAPGTPLGTVDGDNLQVSGQDAWRLIEDQLIANELDIMVTGGGSFQLQRPPAISTVANKHLRTGQTGTIVSYDLQMRGVINEVILTHRARKEGEDEKYLDGVWQDNSALSGVDAIGPRTHLQTVDVGADWWDNLPARQSQADANAAAAAATLRGYAREVRVEAIPDYTFRVGETVRITYRSGETDLYLLTSIEWPFGPGPMRLTCRNPNPDSAIPN